LEELAIAQSARHARDGLALLAGGIDLVKLGQTFCAARRRSRVCAAPRQAPAG
jgi:hypothetical protein